MATTHALMEEALAKAASARNTDLADLMEELRIPSISTLPESRDDCLRNARWLCDRMQALGMTVEIVDVIKNARCRNAPPDNPFSEAHGPRHRLTRSQTKRRPPGVRGVPTISRAEVEHLARLARLAVTDQELDKFAGQLDVILAAVAKVTPLPWCG